MPRRSVVSLIAVTAAVGLSSLAPGAPRTDAVTLVDLAVAYLALDRAVATHPIPPEQLAAVNVSVDIAATHAFSRRPDLAVDRFRAIAAARIASDDPGASGVWVSRIRTRIEPPVHVRGAAPPALRLVAPGSHATAIAFCLRASDGRVVLTGDVPAGEAATTLAGLDDLDAGRYELELSAADDGWILADACAVVDEPSADLRARGAAALEDVPAHLAAARATCLARLELLAPGRPSVDVTRWALDRAKIQNEVTAEIAALLRDVDPYAGQAGDTWMVIPVGDVEIPCRVYAPPASVAPDAPARPLVIALHGVGGNEHMFMDAHGGGLLQRIAEREGCIVVAPLTYPLAADLSRFVPLLERVEALHAFDPSRVYVVGHSLGAMTAARLGAAHPERITALCCIAGAGQAAAEPQLPPAAFYAAELDRMVPAPLVQAAYDQARANGGDVTYRLVPDHGHVLVVAAVLPEAMTWLLSR